MEIYRKTITKSEAKNKIINIELKAYSVNSVDNAGGQASINIPTELRKYLLDNRIVFKDEKLSDKISSEKIKYDTYNLSSSYKLIIDSDLKHILNLESDSNYGFFMISATNTKYQIRPSQYDIVDESSELDYSWLGKLLSKTYVDSELIFICDTDHKTITLSFDPKSKTKINVDEDTVDFQDREEEKINLPLQILYFGAPGTGKSYNLSNIIKEHSWKHISEEEDIDDLPNVFRNTLYADYSYHDFIGTIMPVVNNNNITYEFNPGVFTLSLKYAFQNPSTPVYLILEEMSRANVASVFGDIFQLLDRTPNGESEFKINNDLIAKELSNVNEKFYNDSSETFSKIYLPKNLSILGTINSNDQNVFVMDTAFKRRFDFTYISTDPVYNENQEILNDFRFYLHGKETSWISFYTKLNNFILEKAKLNEDKQIGQFFIKGDLNGNESIQKNTNAIKNKLLNYLWFDVNPAVFSGERIFSDEYLSFYDIYEDFDKENKNIFNLVFEE